MCVYRKTHIHIHCGRIKVQDISHPVPFPFLFPKKKVKENQRKNSQSTIIRFE